MARRHATNRPRLGSTPHDRARVAILRARSSSSLVLHPARRNALASPVAISDHASVVAVQCSRPSIPLPPHRQQPRGSVSRSITNSVRGGEIPIVPTAPPCFPPRFPPLEAFGRRPPLHPPSLKAAGIRNPSQQRPDRRHATTVEECSNSTVGGAADRDLRGRYGLSGALDLGGIQSRRSIIEELSFSYGTGTVRSRRDLRPVVVSRRIGAAPILPIIRPPLTRYSQTFNAMKTLMSSFTTNSPS